MQIVKTIPSIRSILKNARRQNKRIGFVPTMGALHEGHLSLIRRCKKENDITIVSIFVNPAQFGPGEDYKAYPRSKKKDVLLAKKENVDIIFYPSAKNIYPDRYLTYVDVKEITGILCGKFRSGHFRGVTTIVGKLLNILSPDTLYLGQKDAQQSIVIKQMVRDLNFPVKVKVLPTVREADGLAMSSRNKYLSPQQRQEAPVLYNALRRARQKALRGTRDLTKITNLIRKAIRKTRSGKIEYIACVDAETLRPLNVLKGRVLIALAVRFGPARLIDNIVLRIK